MESFLKLEYHLFFGLMVFSGHCHCDYQLSWCWWECHLVYKAHYNEVRGSFEVKWGALSDPTSLAGLIPSWRLLCGGILFPKDMQSQNGVKIQLGHICITLDKNIARDNWVLCMKNLVWCPKFIGIEKKNGWKLRRKKRETALLKCGESTHFKLRNEQ